MVRREVEPFGEAPKGALKLVPLGAKLGTPQWSGCSFQAGGTFECGPGPWKSRAARLQILIFVPSGASSLPRSDAGPFPRRLLLGEGPVL